MHVIVGDTRTLYNVNWQRFNMQTVNWTLTPQ